MLPLVRTFDRPPAPVPAPDVSIWGKVKSLFIPQIQVQPFTSLYEGEPEQARRERPLPTSSTTQWFQSDIEQAILQADSGDLTGAGSLWRSMRRDGAFAGLLSTRAGGLTRLPKIFRGTDNVLADLEPGADGDSLFDRVFPPKELELLDADGIGLGVGVGEMLPFPGREEPIFVRLDPQFLRYRWTDDRWYYASVGGLLPITPGDGRWVLHMPGGYMQPWNQGLWPSLGRAFVAKEHAYMYRENYSSKLANPARVAVSPQGASDEQKQSFFRRVMAWGINTVFGLPPGWDVRLIESNGVGYDVYMQTIEGADKEFMIGLAGQIVTVTGGSGFANAAVFATIRSDLIQGDGDALALTISQQGLRPLVNRLYGSSARASVTWDTRPPADLKAEAEAISAASKAIEDACRVLEARGYEVDVRELVTRFKIPGGIRKQVEQQVNDGRVGKLPAPVAQNDAEPDEPDHAAELAQKMTEHAVARCEHGASNRCRLCGVERVRDFAMGEDGAAGWHVKWKPIAAPAEAA